MIGSFLTRGLVMVFGYAYPAYECYKTVEMNKPEIEQLRFWCQYWILVAVLTVCERVGDAFISWVPMYSEAKLAFFIYLWYPKTKGTSYVYDSFFRPYVSKHENEIDRNLLELRTRAGDMAVLYWQKAASYGQTRIFEILQYVASQSTPRPRPNPPQQNARPHQPPAGPSRQPSPATRPEPELPPSPTSSTSSSEHQKEAAEEVGPSQVPEAGSRARTSSLQRANSSASSSQKALAQSNSQKANSAASNVQKANAVSESTSQSTPTEAEAMQVDPASSAADENENPQPKETVMEETLRITRGRLRKNRSASNR